MKTKILAPCLMLALLTYMTTSLSATNDPVVEGNEISESEAKYEDLQKRADELLFKIQDLKRAKKDADTRAEKKEIRDQAKVLKAELNALEAEAKASGQDVRGGIYIGTGTLIVILLLILLL